MEHQQRTTADCVGLLVAFCDEVQKIEASFDASEKLLTDAVSSLSKIVHDIGSNHSAAYGFSLAANKQQKQQHQHLHDQETTLDIAAHHSFIDFVNNSQLEHGIGNNNAVTTAQLLSIQRAAQEVLNGLLSGIKQHQCERTSQLQEMHARFQQFLRSFSSMTGSEMNAVDQINLSMVEDMSIITQDMTPRTKQALAYPEDQHKATASWELNALFKIRGHFQKQLLTEENRLTHAEGADRVKIAANIEKLNKDILKITNEMRRLRKIINAERALPQAKSLLTQNDNKAATKIQQTEKGASALPIAETLASPPASSLSSIVTTPTSANMEAGSRSYMFSPSSIKHGNNAQPKPQESPAQCQVAVNQDQKPLPHNQETTKVPTPPAKAYSRLIAKILSGPTPEKSPVRRNNNKASEVNNNSPATISLPQQQALPEQDKENVNPMTGFNTPTRRVLFCGPDDDGLVDTNIPPKHTRTIVPSTPPQQDKAINNKALEQSPRLPLKQIRNDDNAQPQQHERIPTAEKKDTQIEKNNHPPRHLSFVPLGPASEEGNSSGNNIDTLFADKNQELANNDKDAVVTSFIINPPSFDDDGDDESSKNAVPKPTSIPFSPILLEKHRMKRPERLQPPEETVLTSSILTNQYMSPRTDSFIESLDSEYFENLINNPTTTTTTTQQQQQQPPLPLAPVQAAVAPAPAPHRKPPSLVGTTTTANLSEREKKVLKHKIKLNLSSNYGPTSKVHAAAKTPLQQLQGPPNHLGLRSSLKFAVSQKQQPKTSRGVNPTTVVPYHDDSNDDHNNSGILSGLQGVPRLADFTQNHSVFLDDDDSLYNQSMNE